MSALPNREPITHAPVVRALPNPPEDIAPGTCIAGRYRIDEVIGRGGMATVYRGHDERLKRDVAIKVRYAHASHPAPPLQEEQVSSRLIHSNVVSIFDAGQIPDDQPGAGSDFIVMEYVHGSNAHDVAPVHWSEAVEIMRQVASGLAAAHEQGVVHCDVTPGNVLIDRTGRVLLADFGVAVETDSEADDFVHGSPSYLAPERVHGAKADARVDIYGLGGVFAYLLTGRHPHSDAPLDLPGNCPAAIRDIIQRARATDPDQRYPNARAFEAALDDAPDLISSGNDSLAHLSADAVTRHVPVVRDPANQVETNRSGTTVADEQPGGTPTPESSGDAALPAATPARDPGRSDNRARIVVAVALAVVLGLLVVDAMFTDSTPATIDPPVVAAVVEMPDVSGMTFADAIEHLSERDIVVSRVDVVYGPGPLNQVVAQEPPAGQEITGAEPVTIVVRTGR
jgi:eukaryotic-like serine/threonine-protein kinase